MSKTVSSQHYLQNCKGKKCSNIKTFVFCSLPYILQLGYAIIITVTSICTLIHLLGYFVYYHKHGTKIKYAQEDMGFRRNIVLNLPNSSLTWHPAGPSPTKESHGLFWKFMIYKFVYFFLLISQVDINI